MKTTIDLTQFNFNGRIFNQISDCPDTGFVRVLVYTGDNYQERIKQWFINAEIVYINTINNKIKRIKEQGSMALFLVTEDLRVYFLCLFKGGVRISEN